MGCQTIQTMNVSGAPARKRVSPVVAQKRLAREWRTISAMIRIYCRNHRHSAQPGQDLCPDCQSLLDYARVRLDRCRFGAEKPTCARCPVHCYVPRRREEVRAVMIYAGPRMLWHHPILSLWHWIDSFRETPPLAERVG